MPYEPLKISPANVMSKALDMLVFTKLGLQIRPNGYALPIIPNKDETAVNCFWDFQ